MPIASSNATFDVYNAGETPGLNTARVANVAGVLIDDYLNGGLGTNTWTHIFLCDLDTDIRVGDAMYRPPADTTQESDWLVQWVAARGDLRAVYLQRSAVTWPTSLI